MLYPPSSANASPMAGQPADDSLRQMFLDIAQRLYNGDDPSDDPTLLRQTAAQLLEGVEKGFGHALPDLEFGTPDYDTLEELARNVYHFSAAKNYHELHDLSLALRDGDRLRSFDEFMHLADEITGKYNLNWLRSEYNQAVAAAQCAARWNEYSSRKDIMPYLQYTAVMDGNTREEHAALNGVVKRMDDPFWDKYYPPNGWGCRCEAVQLPGSHYRETPDTEIQYPAVPKMFLANFGKSRMVFPQGHPYYKRLPKEQEHLLQEKSRAEVRRILDNAERYRTLKADPMYKDVDFDWKTGGLKATHKDHNFDKKGGKYERHVQEAGYNSGHSVILESERHGTFGQKFTEGTWDDKPFEVAGRETATSNNILRGLVHCAKTSDVKVAVLDFPNGGFDQSVVETAIGRYVGYQKVEGFNFVRFEEIICVQDETIVFSTNL